MFAENWKKFVAIAVLSAVAVLLAVNVEEICVEIATFFRL